MSMVALLMLAAGCGGAKGANGAAATGAASPSPSASAAPPVPDSYAEVLTTQYGGDLRAAGIGNGHPFDRAATWLRGPHFSIALVESAGVSWVTDQTAAKFRMADNRGIRPGNGRELLLARFDAPLLPVPYGTGSNPVAEVVVGAERRSLTGDVNARKVIAVSVPVGAPVSLSVTDEGRTQSIDLRTGAVSGRIDGYAEDLHTRISGMGGWINAPGVGRTPVMLSLELKLAPFAPGRGWATAGRAWLTYTATASLLDVDFSCTVDLSRGLTLSGSGFRAAGAGTVSARPYPGSNPSARPGESAEQAIDVPAGLREVTAGFTLRPSCTRDGAAVRVSVVSSAGGKGTLKPARYVG
jgi:hypothetical protein